MTNQITWKIGGEAGFGIMVSGLNFGRTLMRGGLHVFEANEYPSLIRGGHNTETVFASQDPVSAIKKPVDILVSLNKETVDLHKNELSRGAAVMFDPNDFALKEADFSRPVQLYPIPLLELSKNNGGDVLMRNTVAIGASIAIMDFDLELFNGVLTDQFKRKGEAIVTQNKEAARAGYEFVKKNFRNKFTYTLKPVTRQKRQIFLTGNEAIGLGAVAADMNFFAAYPMTPINGLLHYMASIQEKAGFVYKQPEDEIAAINMALGASFAGARSMVATSGGGFALMVEGTSLAGMTENPVVIIYGMRPGPATGLPTWTGQSDLKFVLNAGHGEFPRLVVAPGDVEEAFALTMVAFNLADHYQTPVFLLTDKFLSESRSSIDPEVLQTYLKNTPIDRGKILSENEQAKKDQWDRYELTEDGISPRPVAGRAKGIFRVNSDEHNPDGYSTEDAEMAKKMVEKRMKKLATAQKEAQAPMIYGDHEADITLVGWGSTKGVAKEALSMLRTQGYDQKVNYIQISWINPFPSQAIFNILTGSKKVIDIEGAHNAPMADYIREQTGIAINDKILKYDGRPFYPEEIVEGLKRYG